MVWLGGRPGLLLVLNFVVLDSLSVSCLNALLMVVPVNGPGRGVDSHYWNVCRSITTCFSMTPTGPDHWRF